MPQLKGNLAAAAEPAKTMKKSNGRFEESARKRELLADLMSRHSAGQRKNPLSAGFIFIDKFTPDRKSRSGAY